MGADAAVRALPGRQGRLLFAYLVLNRDRDCGRAELIDVLWPEDPPAAADTALSALLSKLRRALGDGALAGRSELRLVPPGRSTSTSRRAAAAAARAEAAIDGSDWAGGRRARPQRARGRPADLPARLRGPVGRRAAARAREPCALRALEALAEAGLRRGGRELGAAEQAARAAIAAAPFRESAHRLLMEIHEAAGNPAEALRAFEDLRVLLRDELGTTPGAAAMAVHERLLRGEPPGPARSAAPRRWSSRRGPRRSPLRSTGTGSWAARPSSACSPMPGATRWPARRRLVLLAGDAGIGKTRLAAEMARRAREDGAVVLYGRFDEDALAPYQPVVEMVRRWSAGASLEPLRERLGARAAELGILFPELGPPPERARAAVTPTPPAAAFDAIAALLGEARRARAAACSCSTTCTGRTARRSSCSRHLVRAPHPRRVLFLGTYRDAELEPSHALLELARRPAARGRAQPRRARRPRRARGRRAGRRARRARPASRRSSPRCTARPRATRSSSRRSCATCAPAAAGCTPPAR